MIRFSLQCSHTHRFDGWFRSGDDFLTQQKRGLLACPECGSTTVEKALMTPSVPKKSNQTMGPVERPDSERPDSEPQATAAPATQSAPGLAPGSASEPVPQTPVPSQNARQTPQSQTTPPNPLSNLPPEIRGKVMIAVREWRDSVIANSENVGPRFADEARKIHFKEADERPIYGQASADDVQELLEEGIPCAPLPVLPEDHN